ncbi:MAG: hypothetical protein HY094_08380 [Candidatus Melainabacteria bacterium]|nr:hypothetical protein [Candidatus Melainabacteria bacterium]
MITKVYKALKKNIKQTIIITFLVSLLSIIFAYIVSHGSMDLLAREIMGNMYVGTLENLKIGRFDIPAEYAEGERFYRDGKIYMYYGVFPALVRGIIELFFSRGGTDWSRISITLAAIIIVISCIGAYLMLASRFSSTLFAKYYYAGLFALSITFGSPVIFLLSCAYIYDEAMMWGLAWTCVFTWAFMSIVYSKNINNKILFILSISSGFALLTRITFFLSTMPAIMLLTCVFILEILPISRNLKLAKSFLDWVSMPKLSTPLWKTLLALWLPLLLCISFQLKINYERWGHPLIFKNFKYYENALRDPGSLILFERSGGFLNFSRIPEEFLYYFIPTKNHFSKEFPYIKIAPYDNSVFKINWVHIYPNETGNPLPINSFYFFFTALISLFTLSIALHSLGFFLLLSFLMSAIFHLGIYTVSLRYTADLIPFFILCSIASFATLIKFENINKNVRIASRVLMFVVTVIGIFASTATMIQEKIDTWAVPDVSRVQLKLFCTTVDDLLNRYIFNKNNTLQIIESKNELLNPKKGQLWVADDKTIFSFNGSYWLPVKDEDKKYRSLHSYGPIRMKIRFNIVPGTSEPLLTTGKINAGDFVYVKYFTEGKAVFGYDHWGWTSIISKPIVIDPKHLYSLEISTGSLIPDISPYLNPIPDALSPQRAYRDQISIKLDGKSILELQKTNYSYDSTEDEISIGKNQIGGTRCGPIFTGEIRDIEHLAFED